MPVTGSCTVKRISQLPSATDSCSHRFMIAETGMGEPRRLINYTGHLRQLTKRSSAESDCPYCKGNSKNLLEPFPMKPRGMHWATYERLFFGSLASERSFFDEEARRLGLTA